ncbi:ubiquitin-specific protease ubp2 [Tulasnella sp. 419]|nr:ubiquitin-specific protease ubp2 [Tulasnella sp. 419]
MTSGDSKVKYTNDKTADVTSALSESSFFGGDSSRSAASAAPAPLPPRRAGTLHTAYYPPTSTSTQASIPRHPTPDPPAYDHQVGEATIMDGHEGPSYRSPVALPPSPAASMPELIEANGGWDNAQPSWDAAPSWKGTGVAALEYAGWRETSWWDPAIMTTGRIKPGKGYLPCGLIKYLHDEDHSPIRVEVTPPDISSDESSGHTSPSTHTNLPPSRLEITQSIPHPHAYFCRKHNGWVLFRVQRSAVLPSPLYQDADVTVPDPAMRKEKHDCLQEDANSRSAWGQSNRFATHHFHYYRKVVLGSSISPPFKKSHGPANEDPKSHSRNDNMELDSTAVPILSEDEMLLDLSVCCQCQVYIVSSGSRVIPAVVPRQIMHRFINDRQKNPAPGQSGADTVMFCLGTVLRIIENHLWRLKTASLNVGSVSRKIGWDDNIKELFASFGFTHEVAPKQDGQPEGRLCSPKTWGSSKDAAFNRARLLRAWVEIGAIAAEYRKRNATELTGHEYNKLWVTVQYARDEIQREIGAHPDQTPRNEIIENRILEANEKPWLFLGTTFRTHSAAIVEAAYHSQRHCDPINTPTYFSALQDITTWATEHLARDPSTEGLQNLAMVERSKGLWTHEDLRWAHQILGIWDDETSRVMDGLRPEDIREAWRKKLKELSEEAKKMRAVTGGAEWNRPPTMTASKKDLKEAFRIISESMGSTSAMATFDEAIKVYESAMDIDEAYSTLDVPQDLDEDTMVVIFQMRLEDQPLAAKRMKQALSVIAEDRDSARLRTLAETGKDEGPPPPDSSRPEWPRGLQQLGNTCYLNSLLQYFYTIKGLREAILDSNTDLFAGSTVTDDHIKQNRVGGRLVTRREVERSKKFVTHLRKLFNDLQVSDLPSVKPELELAKLALVTSKDEEEEVKSESSQPL